MTLDAVLLRDIWHIRSDVKVGNGAQILVYGIGTISCLLF
jgi:hypothetical protein